MRCEALRELRDVISQETSVRHRQVLSARAARAGPQALLRAARSATRLGSSGMPVERQCGPFSSRLVQEPPGSVLHTHTPAHGKQGPDVDARENLDF